MTTLQLNTSLFGAGGQSTTLAAEFVARRGGKVIVRDLAKDPVPHLDAERFGAFLAKPEARTAEQPTMGACGSHDLRSHVASVSEVLGRVAFRHFSAGPRSRIVAAWARFPQTPVRGSATSMRCTRSTARRTC